MMQVEKALRAGYSLFCSTCTKFWRAADGKSLMLPSQCQAVDGCCGPLSGGSFHEYDGPLTSTDRWCFVCGDAATHLVSSLTGKKFGMCSKHITLAKTIQPVGKPKPRLIMYNPSSVEASDDPVRYKKPSLVEAILEVESFYDKNK